MKLNAYVMLSDPAWLFASVASYYHRVDRIIASYDRDSVGWNGQPIDVAGCRSVLERLDTDRKVVWMPGSFIKGELSSLQADTRQRQVALDAASEGADWVLQLDTDEVVPRWDVFSNRLEGVRDRGLTAFWYPQRWLFARFSDRWFWESSRWRILTLHGHPGPLAVAAGSHLVLARQDDSERLFLAYKGPLKVRASDAVLHFSWVRSPEAIQAKVLTSGHADDTDLVKLAACNTLARLRPLHFWIDNIRDPFPRPMRPVRLRGPIYADPFVDAH